MRFITAAIVGTTILLGSAYANNCRQGLLYCGHSLLITGTCTFDGFPLYYIFKSNLAKGDYSYTIQQATVGAGRPPEEAGDTLFDCLEGGWLKYVRYCGSGQCATNSNPTGNDACTERKLLA